MHMYIFWGTPSHIEVFLSDLKKEETSKVLFISCLKSRQHADIFSSIIFGKQTI